MLVGMLTCATVRSAEPAPTEEIKYYDVEIVIFKNVSVPKGHEFNLPTPAASPTENTVDLADPTSLEKARDFGFEPLKAEELRLQESVDKIVKSSRYQLLTHIGWRQPGLDQQHAIPIWIKGGTVFGPGYSSIDEILPAKSVTAESNPDQIATAEINPNGLYELEGLITVTLSRYLHTKADLVLRKPADPYQLLQQSDELADTTAQEVADIEGQLLLNYALNEKRRMRSKKLHYLDNPEFGLLVLITPYEAPAAVVDEPLPESSPQPQNEPATTG
jgi:hypothetical protein